MIKKRLKLFSNKKKLFFHCIQLMRLFASVIGTKLSCCHSAHMSFDRSAASAFCQKLSWGVHNRPSYPTISMRISSILGSILFWYLKRFGFQINDIWNESYFDRSRVCFGCELFSCIKSNDQYSKKVPIICWSFLKLLNDEIYIHFWTMPFIRQ